jgi:Domain of unknown function (DUF3601)
VIGPEPGGHWTASMVPKAFKHLAVGARYAVVREFADFDGGIHPAGETWWFRGHNFLPYDDGLSLFVSLDGQREWHIRLQWVPEQQGRIIDDLETYVRATGTDT